MYIREMFAKAIDRDIKAVIKVGQTDDENMRRELEEYVVTREIQKNLAKFFSEYKKGINDPTDKIAVWISGFFGSGKSQFLKILSYLLANKKLNDKSTLDYFIENKKIDDSTLLSNIKLSAQFSTDIILFNIDSKSSADVKASKDEILSVFLKSFNEMQGFCTAIPLLADLERNLLEAKRYEEFMKLFKNNYGKDWHPSRHKFDFIQDYIVAVLSEMKFMTEDSARNFCKKATQPYRINIEEFSRLIKNYIDQKGENHRVVFLADEIGQYIGNDSKLMLNLQTLTEDLATVCQGKAWIIVTSQQDIDAMTKDTDAQNNDFSKIQGRFDIRLSLSSANVDEVIKKRVLEKNSSANKNLSSLYAQKATIIKNLIVFNALSEKFFYVDGKDFSSVYPFVPYQFGLLASALQAIRKYAVSGKHLSEGERSMLALFKESAMMQMNREIGSLVPFYVFYDVLREFLEQNHKTVISKAADNKYINPEREENCFHINVLKTLFLLKYVKGIVANTDNIVSFMVDSIDADRIKLKKRTEESLKILLRQTLLQKNGDVYTFLTDEEQTVNHEIHNQIIEISEVMSKVSELIFEDIYKSKSYRCPIFKGRYQFRFNRIVDDKHHKKTQNYDIGIRILTPNIEYTDESTIRMMSEQGKDVLMLLPNDSSFLDEVRNALQIEKYLRTSTTTSGVKYEQIKESKQSEIRERNNNAKLFLIESLRNAEIYVNGDKLSVAVKDVSARINEALGSLVAVLYHKLTYIDTPMNEANVQNLLNESEPQNLRSELNKNENAAREILEFISVNEKIATRTSMKNLMNRFTKVPYGFIKNDITWLLARLLKSGDISFRLNEENITLHNSSPDEILEYMTKREFAAQLFIQRHAKITESQKKSAREILKILFSVSNTRDADDEIMQIFQQQATELMNELEEYELLQKQYSFPAKNIVSLGKSLLEECLQLQSSTEFFNHLHCKRDDYLDFAEDYEAVKEFFEGDQKLIYQKALEYICTYDNNKNFIVNEQIEKISADIKLILKKDIPYKDIPKLSKLCDVFQDGYRKIFDTIKPSVQMTVDEARERIATTLANKLYKEEVVKRCYNLFDELDEKLQNCNDIATLQSIRIEADALKLRLLNEIDENNKLDNLPKRKNISIKTINVSDSWLIETSHDADKYISALRERILQELQDNTTINIEF